MSRTPHRDFDGTHWDTRRLRRVREAGWFRQHEADLIREAGLRRARLLDAAAESYRRSGRYRCPKCGQVSTALRSLGGLTVGECGACGWIFVERSDIERLVARLNAAPHPEAEPARPGDRPPAASAD